MFCFFSQWSTCFWCEESSHGRPTWAHYSWETCLTVLHSLLDVDSTNLDDYNIHVIASVFKQWLRDLPNPLLTFELYEEFIRAMGKWWFCCVGHRRTRAVKHFRAVVMNRRLWFVLQACRTKRKRSEECIQWLTSWAERTSTPWNDSCFILSGNLRGNATLPRYRILVVSETRVLISPSDGPLQFWCFQDRLARGDQPHVSQRLGHRVCSVYPAVPGHHRPAAECAGHQQDHGVREKASNKFCQGIFSFLGEQRK